jgi:hypothetical protein
MNEHQYEDAINLFVEHFRENPGDNESLTRALEIKFSKFFNSNVDVYARMLEKDDRVVDIVEMMYTHKHMYIASDKIAKIFNMCKDNTHAFRFLVVAMKNVDVNPETAPGKVLFSHLSMKRLKAIFYNSEVQSVDDIRDFVARYKAFGNNVLNKYEMPGIGEYLGLSFGPTGTILAGSLVAN